MEADLLVQTSSEATSTGNTTTESVVQLPRVPSSPVITSSSGTTASIVASAAPVTSSNEANEANEAAATQGNNFILRDEDAFLCGGGGNSGSSTRNRTMMSSSSYYRQPNRRERSLSSISSPNSHFPTGSTSLASKGQQPQGVSASTAASRGHHHQRSSSAILDLDPAGFEPTASKRRSLSTAAASDRSSSSSSFYVNPTVSTPTTSITSLTTASLAETEVTTTVPVASPTSTTVTGTEKAGSKLPVSVSKSRGTTVPTSTNITASGSHVRFFETDRLHTDKPYKCHHLLSNDETELSHNRWPSTFDRTLGASGQQSVQRTNSNPEMELCSVCMARKECEILLKRTWSKVN